MHTIVLQDDPELLRTLERGILRRSGLRLVLAATSDEVVARSQRDSPAIVILDRDIPGGSPVALVDTLRALPVPPVCLIVDDEFVLDIDDGGEPRRAPIQDSICRRLGLTGRGAMRQPLRCAVRVHSEDECRRGTTRDISSSGAFVVTRAPFETERGVEVRLGALGERSVAGRVVRSVAPSSAPDCLPGMAIQFDDADRLSAADMEASISAAMARVKE